MILNKLNKIKIYITVNKYILIPIFGKETLAKMFYKFKTKEKLNLRSPIKYNEKIQSRKLDENNTEYIKCADKFLVRDVVKKRIGEEYLIKNYFAKEKITVEDLKELPNSFVLKTNNASQTNIIVFDKTEENLNDLVKKMNSYVKLEYGYAMLELFYNNIKPLIIAEELLVGEDGQVPYDYKFHCFKENNDFKIYIQVDYDRFQNHQRNMYNEDWKLLDFTIGFKTEQREVEKPEKLKEMIELTKKMSNKYNYSRVDFYLCNGDIYFGEITFTHGSGYERFTPDEMNIKFGELWKDEN